MAKRNLKIYTIGHSNHNFEKFVELLKKYQIDAVADVRSKPYLRYAKHFDFGSIENQLKSREIGYIFFGHLLGGEPAQKEFYDEYGYVDYRLISQSAKFKEGINRILIGITNKRVALMCSEEDPTNCHRRLLLSRVFQNEGVKIFHIRGSGNLQTEEEICEEEAKKESGQMSLFDAEGEKEWKSTQSVLRKRVRPNSSKPSKATE